MRILKPIWVDHTGFPIFSLDVHPDGTRLATGGGDNKVKVWSVAPIMVQEAEEDENVPKLLKSMDSHYGPVNSVRWSRDGKYLASGGDDKLVMIWGLSKFSNMGSGLGTEKTVENWICVNTLRDHNADISDVAWSYDNKFLATCGVDKTIIIWDVTKEFKKVKELQGHKGFVKGLSWDPIGRYLASQSDDKSVIIWRTSDWQIETRIEDPFQNQVNTFFLRSSWSPDGQFLCATHGLNQQTHTAPSIQRTTWNTAFEFVGHRKPIIVARYSPIIYKDPKDKKFSPHFCVLLGGQDNTITLWTSKSPRPILILNTLFDQSIQDIAWCPDGLSFFACSTDGTIGYMSLSNEEVKGIAITVAEKSQFLHQAYGDAVSVGRDGTIIAGGVRSNSSADHVGLFAENPDQLVMEESSNDIDLNGGIGGGGGVDIVMGESSPSISTQSTQDALKNQKQTIINGRRRITPLNHGGVSQGSQSITKPQPVQVPSHIHIESKPSSQLSDDNVTMNNSTTTNIITPTTTATTSNITDTNGTGSSSLPNTPTPTPVKNNPFLTPTSTPTSTKQITPSKPTSNISPTSKTNGREVIPDKVSKVVSSGSRQSASKENTDMMERILQKRRNDDSHVAPSSTSTSKKNKTTTKSTPTSTPKTNDSSKNTPTTNTLPLTSQPIFIAPPNTTNNHIVKIFTHETSDHFNKTNPSLTLDVVVESQELPDNTIEHYSTIRLITDMILWEDRIFGKVTMVAGNVNWCAVSTIDALVHVYNKNGGIIMSNIVLRNQVSFIEASKSDHLLIVTCDGFVNVWNITTKQLKLSNRELPYIINRDKQTIKYAFITDQGKPIITVSNGDSFVYSSEIGEWVKLTDRLGSLSEFNSNDSVTSNGILSRIQQQSKTLSMGNMVAITNSEQQHQIQNSTTFLEKQLYFATILESPQEYKHWLFIYTKYLTTHDCSKRLSDLCNDLLGPSPHPNVEQWAPTIMGFVKRDLLKDVLKIMSSNRNLQRIIGQYNESLKVFVSSRDIQSLESLFSAREI